MCYCTIDHAGLWPIEKDVFRLTGYAADAVNLYLILTSSSPQSLSSYNLRLILTSSLPHPRLILAPCKGAAVHSRGM